MNFGEKDPTLAQLRRHAKVGAERIFNAQVTGRMEMVYSTHASIYLKCCSQTTDNYCINYGKINLNEINSKKKDNQQK